MTGSAVRHTCCVRSEMPHLETVLRDGLNDLEAGWNVGSFGAIAEFHHLAGDLPGAGYACRPCRSAQRQWRRRYGDSGLVAVWAQAFDRGEINAIPENPGH